MPAIATLLTLPGVVPLLVFAFGAVGHIPKTAERMLLSLSDDPALVLTFAGGIHRGLALLPPVERPSPRFGRGYCLRLSPGQR